MNKTEFIEAVAEQAGVSKKDTKSVIEAVMEVVTETLKNGNSIQLTGFGTFKSVYKEASTARNPKTGEVVSVPAKNVPKFVFGKTIKEAIK